VVLASRVATCSVVDLSQRTGVDDAGKKLVAAAISQSIIPLKQREHHILPQTGPF